MNFIDISMTDFWTHHDQYYFYLVLKNSKTGLGQEILAFIKIWTAQARISISKNYTFKVILKILISLK
jgi:hypothetical protein